MPLPDDWKIVFAGDLQRFKILVEPFNCSHWCFSKYIHMSVINNNLFDIKIYKYDH